MLGRYLAGRLPKALSRAITDPGVGGGAFDPATILGIVGYYDLETLATFTQDEAGAVLVTAANQTAKRLIDTSGNGLHLTNASGMVVRGTPQGPNLLGDNGLFLFDTNAIAGAGWVIGEGRATATASNAAMTFPVAATAGRIYLIRYFVAASAGSVQPNFGGASGVARSTEIHAEGYVTASTTGQLLLNATGFSGWPVVDAVTYSSAMISVLRDTPFAPPKLACTLPAVVDTKYRIR